MRILLVNKFNYLFSGTERYLFNLKHLLETKGHEVEIFAMQHPRNHPARYEKCFVPYVDFYDLDVMRKAKAIRNVIWHPQPAHLIAQVLDDFRPDMVHLHNIYHQLSPSILPPITRRSIPIVQTLHDYKLICPNYLLYTQESPCTRCRTGQYWQAVRHRCLHDSLSWSTLAALEMTLHKTWQIYEKHVAKFVTPSRFLKQICEDFGSPSSQLVHIPYSTFISEISLENNTKDQGYFVYIGRLSPEKGLFTLIQAMQYVPEAQLHIMGDGDIRTQLEDLKADLALSNVTFRGYLKGQALTNALEGARFTVIPSEWYENFPNAILEAFVAGKAVIGSEMGGIPELIDEGETGRLFPAGDVMALAACIRDLWHHPDKAYQMGQRGREKVLTHYTPEKHYKQLFPLYQSLVEARSKG